MDKMAIIVLDPGHGGTTKVGGSSPNNATSKPRGILEKTVTLQVAQLAKTALQARGHAVHLTRVDDTNIGLAARAGVARTRKADVFLSIHFNGWTTPDVQGTETFFHPAAPSRSSRLAQAVLKTLVAATGYANRGAKPATYAVLDPASHLAITAASLAEISFITAPAEDARLDKAAYLQSLGAAVADGVQAYLDAQFPPKPA
jgi:N-acetylmuramoyl-L-alanine amidase